MDSIRLEQIEVSHLAQLQQIGTETFTEAFAGANNPEDFRQYLEEAFDADRLRRELTNPESRFFFLYDGGHLIGYSKINTGQAQTELKDPDGMEIERIYVRGAAQGRGLGTWMLDRLKAIARAEGMSYLWLGVWEENHDAIRFYKQHGFVTFGKHPYYVGSDRQMDWMMRFQMEPGPANPGKTP
jgi:ribosomal protein S18 acetylase RimI-like enzyme